MNNKLEINEIIIMPLLGFRVSQSNISDDNIFINLEEYIENTPELEFIDLVYQGHIGFTINAQNEKELKEIINELDKYISYEYDENLLSALDTLFKYNIGMLYGKYDQD